MNMYAYFHILHVPLKHKMKQKMSFFTFENGAKIKLDNRSQ